MTRRLSCCAHKFQLALPALLTSRLQISILVNEFGFLVAANLKVVGIWYPLPPVPRSVCKDAAAILIGWIKGQLLK